MSLNLIRRLIKGTPLDAADHDGNLDKLETAILARPTTTQANAAYATAAQGALAATAIQPGDATLSDAREWTASTISQLEAETGTATTRRAFTAQRVFQAIAAWWAASSAASKLAGIEAGAEVNVNADWNASSGDAQILNKPTIPAPADANPLGPGTAAVGTSTEYAREDHVHPPSPLVSTSTAGLQAPTGFGTITYASTVDLDLAALNGQVNSITLTGPLTFTTSNLANGRVTGLRLIPGASARDLTFPADWVFVSAKPASLPANKTARLTIEAHGTTNADVIAAIAIQP